jgi:hypothetical protein
MLLVLLVDGQRAADIYRTIQAGLTHQECALICAFANKCQLSSRNLTAFTHFRHRSVSIGNPAGRHILPVIRLKMPLI